MTASNDRSDILELGIERPDTAALTAPLPATSARPASSAKKRLKIWQIPSGWLCSVVGTCLTASDVERIVRRCGLSFPDDTQTYDIHGFMVARASERDRSPARSPGPWTTSTLRSSARSARNGTRLA